MFKHFLVLFWLVLPITAHATCVEIDPNAKIIPKAELCTTTGCFNIEMSAYCGNYYGSSANFTSVLGDLDTQCTAIEAKTSDHIETTCRVTLNKGNDDISDELLSCEEMIQSGAAPNTCSFFGKDFDINFDRYNSIDFFGNDIAGADRKSVSLSQCETICEENIQCVSYAYLENLNWCFPKSDISEVIPKLGVTSGLLRYGGCERNVSNMAEVRSCVSERSSLGYEILLKKLIFELKQQKQNELANFYEAHKDTVSEEINTFCGLLLESGEADLVHYQRWDTAIKCNAFLYQARELELKKLIFAVETGNLSAWNPWAN